MCCEVTLLSQHLYMNEYQSIFWMLHKAGSKRLLLAGDAFRLQYKYARSCDKVDYVRLNVRHERMDALERPKDATRSPPPANSASTSTRTTPACSRATAIRTAPSGWRVARSSPTASARLAKTSCQGHRAQTLSGR